MRPEQIEVGAEYRCRLERGVVPVRVVSAAEGGGWMVADVETGQPEHVRRHEQFRERCSPPALYPADVAETIAETGAYPPPLDRIDGERLANDVKTRPAEFDPDRCATPRCKREPAMTYLGKPLCQACWEAATRETTNDGAESAAKETTMSKKNASKKTTTKTPKTAKAVKVTKKSAAKPKAERKPAADAKPTRLSALDAAAAVLRKSGQAMRSQEMIAAMAEQGLWTSPNGKTPHATLYAAILREIGVKGGKARFNKVERGKFEFNAKAD